MPDTDKDISNNPPGERQPMEQDKNKDKGQAGAGQSSPGLKDKEAPTSDSYGNTRDSGEPASR